MEEHIERTFKTNLNGKELEIGVGKFANQADSAVTARIGGTMVLSTVTIAEEIREGVNFLPLVVDYEERMYASGKILGSRFIKREGKPTDEAVLTARAIDRSIRPLFPKNYFYDVQVIVTVLSADLENDPDFISIIATSCALLLSPIPWKGPIGAVRVGRKDNRFILNPLNSELSESDLELLLVGSEKGIVMIEAGAKEISEKDMIEAINFGLKGTLPLINFQKEIIKEFSISKQEINEEEFQDPELAERIKEILGNKLEEAIFQSKSERAEAIENLFEQLTEELKEEFPEEEDQLKLRDIFDLVVKKEIRKIIKSGKRPDGRRFDEIRPISCEVGLLPRVHGSGLFNRGETQVLTATTLGSTGRAQLIDTMEEETTKRFMHHYNFPPFSTGDVKPLRAPSRREIGHGALAEKALNPVIPEKDVFPYTIRLVSEVLSSNGSTSMASVCASTLALMDAGVPIKRPVAGIAMGLVDEIILTDIQGIEDGAGDMDFKIAGTERGITALQLDIKIPALEVKLISEIFKKAKEARDYILSKIKECIPAPRKKLSPFAPRIGTIKIKPEKIRDLIGPGGRTINKIISETDVEIDIEEDGTINVCSHDEASLEKALKMIKEVTAEVEVGKIYKGRVTRISDFGAFVEVLPYQEGLVHISELSDQRVKRVEDVVKVGDIIPVKVIGIDPFGRITLSLKRAKKTEKFSRKFSNPGFTRDSNNLRR